MYNQTIDDRIAEVERQKQAAIEAERQRKQAEVEHQQAIQQADAALFELQLKKSESDFNDAAKAFDRITTQAKDTIIAVAGHVRELVSKLTLELLPEGDVFGQVDALRSQATDAYKRAQQALALHEQQLMNKSYAQGIDLRINSEFLDAHREHEHTLRQMQMRIPPTTAHIMIEGIKNAHSAGDETLTRKLRMLLIFWTGYDHMPGVKINKMI